MVGDWTIARTRQKRLQLTKQDSFLVQSMKLIRQGVGKEWKKLDHFIIFFELELKKELQQ